MVQSAQCSGLPTIQLETFQQSQNSHMVRRRFTIGRKLGRHDRTHTATESRSPWRITRISPMPERSICCPEQSEPKGLSIRKKRTQTVFKSNPNHDREVTQPCHISNVQFLPRGASPRQGKECRKTRLPNTMQIKLES